MNINISVDIADIVDEMRCSCEHKELLELIKQIDKEIAEYDFTAALRDYFVAEMKKEEEHLTIGEQYTEAMKWFDSLDPEVKGRILGVK